MHFFYTFSRTQISMLTLYYRHISHLVGHIDKYANVYLYRIHNFLPSRVCRANRFLCTLERAKPLPPAPLRMGMLPSFLSFFRKPYTLFMYSKYLYISITCTSRAIKFFDRCVNCQKPLFVRGLYARELPNVKGGYIPQGGYKEFADKYARAKEETQ